MVTGAAAPVGPMISTLDAGRIQGASFGGSGSLVWGARALIWTLQGLFGGLKKKSALGCERPDLGLKGQIWDLRGMI